MFHNRLRLECLKLAVQMCQTASAFDRPERVLELAEQFFKHCEPGGPSALELGKAARQLGEKPLVDSSNRAPDPGEQMQALKALPKVTKKDMAKFLR